MLEMERVSENKICAAIEQCLEKGNNRFIIYPYGGKGKIVKLILNEEYGIEELALVDNYLASIEGNVYSAEDAYQKFHDYIILFSAQKEEVRKELEKTRLYAENRENIVDIAKLQVATCEIFSFKGRKMEIDSCNEEQLKNIFARTHEIWTKLGEEEPYWSVLTDDKYLSENMEENKVKEFYQSGEENAKQIAATLIRNELAEDVTELKDYTITEIGCGCGRVTKSLAALFGHVNAIDISKGNMNIAKNIISSDNVTFQLILNVDEYRNLPKTDVIYSYIVLQHNCPPVIEYIIDSMLKALNERGIAMFQVPTYERGERFNYEEYIHSEMSGIEMHVIPQQKVFEIAYRNNCIPLEVYQDDATRKDDYSTCFVMKKIGKSG